MLRGAYVFGIYPRSEELIELSRQSASAFMSSALEESKKLYTEQLELNMAYAADPELVWDDMFRPIALSTKGIKVNGLNRFFETNTFYKVPIIENYTSIESASLKGYFAYSGLKRSLITFPDPFTMCCLSRSQLEGRQAVKAIGAILSDSARVAHDAGYEALALKGPSYATCSVGDLYGEVLEAISNIKKSFKGKVMLHIYFGGPLKENLATLKEAEVDVLGLDPRASGNVKLDGRFKAVSFGLIDGLNTKMEAPSAVVKDLESLASLWGVSEVYLTNNVDLEFLPEKYANAKLKLMGEVVREWST